eukprot:SAG22_NODE_2635_length_2348_cov_16.497554_1_plen_41_part_10
MVVAARRGLAVLAVLAALAAVGTPQAHAQAVRPGPATRPAT